jgi:hypothetical protein
MVGPSEEEGVSLSSDVQLPLARPHCDELQERKWKHVGQERVVLVQPFLQALAEVGGAVWQPLQQEV